MRSLLRAVGGMAEWLIAPVLKTGVPQGIGGSNPSPSAISEWDGVINMSVIAIMAVGLVAVADFPARGDPCPLTTPVTGR